MSHSAQSTDRPLRTLVLGGARSGKSAFAEQLVVSEAVRYIATAVPDPGDADFAERIAAHRVRRPGNWTIVEHDLLEALAELASVTLVDDLGTWLTARIDAHDAWESPRGTVASEMDALVDIVATYPERLIIVSPEVGFGVVPATRSGRLFRDELGTLNQRLAQLCDEVYLVVAGQAIQVKPDRAIASAAALATSGLGGGAVVDSQVAGGAAVGTAAESSATQPVSNQVPTDIAATADPSVAQAASTSVASAAAGVAVGGVAEATAAGTAAPATAPDTVTEGAATMGGAAADSADGGVADSTAAAATAVGSTGAPVAPAAGSTAARAAGQPGAANLSKPARIAFGPVNGPDPVVRAAAEARQLQLTKPAGALGRLEQLANWVAACQGVCPPRQFERARIVVFAGDHGVARHGVSAYPSEVTAQMVGNFLNGGAAVNVLARLADATVRVEDIAVDGDTAPEISRHKVRRSSGSIDREDALTEAEVQTALAAGAAIADEEIDSGADLLIAGDMGIGNTTPATVLIAALTDTEPVVAVGRGTGVDDAGWIRKTAAIRDAMWRARPVIKDPVALLRTASGADLAAMAGFLARAAARRTPVILDGVVVTAAALVADQLAVGAREWWIAGHRSSEPSHTIALERLELEPLVEMNMRLGEGSGAVTALPILRAAIATLSEMATFADAGVSTADAAEPAGA
ncbi:nicotinate-nucleotide--dimethylbenzimidazole phosphoribosyltransferase [Nocardia sp. NBC_01388]|uniref:nicotinate-nucleotide--dimethylbenzimidazole phosphoribosyltransferase n=1 Tax=Nocardia sp. NBC_01388 TaxID=2903596 RepID=UPI0032501E9F